MLLVVSALSSSYQMFLFLSESGSQAVVNTHPADAWLGAVAQGTMDTYVNSILQIPSLGEEASQQLAADIGNKLVEWSNTIISCIRLFMQCVGCSRPKPLSHTISSGDAS